MIATRITSAIVLNKPRTRAWFVCIKGKKATAHLAETVCFKTKQAAQDFVRARDKIQQRHDAARARLFKQFAKHIVQKVDGRIK